MYHLGENMVKWWTDVNTVTSVSFGSEYGQAMD